MYHLEKSHQFGDTFVVIPIFRASHTDSWRPSHQFTVSTRPSSLRYCIVFLVSDFETRWLKRRKRTSHPRIAHGQWYPMPCLEWLAEEVEWERGSGPKGPMSCRTKGWISGHPEGNISSRVTKSMVKFESHLPRGRNVTISITDDNPKIWWWSDKVYSWPPERLEIPPVFYRTSAL